MQPFKNFIPAFVQQLNTVVPAGITNDAYAQQYLQTLIQHKEHYLRIYAYVLEKAFAATNSTNVALLDFGTGNGLLALFAKFCGVEKLEKQGKSYDNHNENHDYTIDYIDKIDLLSNETIKLTDDVNKYSLSFCSTFEIKKNLFNSFKSYLNDIDKFLKLKNEFFGKGNKMVCSKLLLVNCASGVDCHS